MRAPELFFVVAAVTEANIRYAVLRVGDCNSLPAVFEEDSEAQGLQNAPRCRCSVMPGLENSLKHYAPCQILLTGWKYAQIRCLADDVGAGVLLCRREGDGAIPAAADGEFE